MKVYKHIQFGEGISCTLAEFKKTFENHLIGLSDSEVKQAYKVATNGNNTKPSKKVSKSKKK